MKIVVTIIQARRAVLPYYFVRHALPKMQARPGVEVEAVLIQHRADASGGNTRLASMNEHGDGLGRVADWTASGRYDGADVVAHSTVHRPYPSVPSYHLAVEEALRREADFHVWLEDDALLCDEDCDRWDEWMGPSEVGVYRYFHRLNTAYLVTRPSYDRRILPALADYERWSKGQRLERFLHRSLRTSRTYLNPACAVRHHPREFPYTGRAYVAEMARWLSPEDAHLLDLEFGAGTSTLAAPDLAQKRAHAKNDGRGLKSKVLRAYVGALERSRMELEGRTGQGPWAGGWDDVLR